MSLAVKAVHVAVLEQVKLNKSKIWVESGDASDDAEAIIRHVSSTIYVLEVRKRGVADPVFKFDFPKIKSYRMKTSTWHELRYEGDKKFALRFKEGERNFQAFYDQLQVILKLHNKSTKPKYNEDFMKEIRMFKLQMLTPVDKSSKGRKAGSSDNNRTISDDSGVSIGSGANYSGESFASRPLQRLGANIKPTPPQIPPQRQPTATRHSNDLPARSVEDWQLPRERPDSADDSYSDRASSIDEDTFYSASEHYSDQSTVELDRRRQRVTSGPSVGSQSPEAADRPPPPVPLRKPKDPKDYVNVGTELGKSKPNSPPPPPLNPLARSRSNIPPQTPATAAPQGRQNQTLPRQFSLQDSSSSSSVYGTAQSWRCKCSLINLPATFRCAACEWTRTDAWECRNCSMVYSVDVVHCQMCPAWRCRLCTFVNGGTNADKTVCEACRQK